MALWPTVVSGLKLKLEALPAFSGVPVYDGMPNSAEQTSSYVALGFVLDEDGGGSVSFTQDGSGFFTTETGEIRCEVWAANGDGDLAAARTAAFALTDAVLALIGDDRTLGGLLPNASSCDLSVDVVPTETKAGTGQLLVMSISYVTPVS